MVDRELEDGLRSGRRAHPRQHRRRRTALNVSVHALRTTLDELRRRLLPLVLETTAAIEADLQAAPVR